MSSSGITRWAIWRTSGSESQGNGRNRHVWSRTAVAAGQPGYYEELAAARAGTATTVLGTYAIPDWPERVVATRDRR
jgi:hypothetical protein